MTFIPRSEIEQPDTAPPLFVISSTLPNRLDYSYLQNHPSITFPDGNRPIAPQLDRFLAEASFPSPEGRGVRVHFGNMATTRHSGALLIKSMAAELPYPISLEARAFLLTDTVLNTYPLLTGDKGGFPPGYDYNYMAHLTRDVYGGNGLYEAFNEWVDLRLGRHPQIRGVYHLPWITMHIKHTIGANTGILENFEAQGINNLALTLLDHFYDGGYYAKRGEPKEDYIRRMQDQAVKSITQLQKLSFLPAFASATERRMASAVL